MPEYMACVDGGTGTSRSGASYSRAVVIECAQGTV
jgi:hypothetical protein